MTPSLSATILWSLGCLVVLALSGSLRLAAAEADFHIAPSGSDEWSGRPPQPNPAGTDGPFATLERARRAVRQLKAASTKKDVSVAIRGGTYRLDGPVVFGPEDGGTKDHSVTYAAWPGETPVFTGGRRITGWKSDGKLWTVELPQVKAGRWHFCELFVNGRRCRRARSPNQGFFRVVSAGPDNRTSFTFRPGELARYENLGEAEIVFLHDWCISRVGIHSVDEAGRTVTLADPIGASLDFFAITGFEPHPRYFVENARELLDEPGEWYLDRKSGLLSYWAREGEGAAADIVTPAAQRLLQVRGDPAGGRPVENLRFVGLSFEHCAWPRPAHGYAAGQAGFHEVRSDGQRQAMRARMPAAVEFAAARNCGFEEGRIAHVGGVGISLRGGCEGCRVVGNEIADVAGNGVMVGEPGQAPEDLASGNLIASNYVHHCGAEFHGCVGIWAGITAGTAVRHNEIAHLPYTGVSVGWQWDPRPTPCGANIIEANHIHHVMELLSDGGGIYTLGRQAGTVLRGNLIHDIPPNAGRAESNGMFIDEGSSLILIEDNVIHAVARSSIRFHKAEKNTLRRNTLAVAPGQRPFTFNACREDSMSFEGNRVAEAKGFAAPEPAELKAGLEAPYRQRLLKAN